MESDINLQHNLHIGQGDYQLPLYQSGPSSQIPKNSTSPKKKSTPKSSIKPKKPKKSKDENPDNSPPSSPDLEVSIKYAVTLSKYQEYIQSESFQFDSIKTICERCALFSSSESSEIEKFWKSHLNLLINYSENNPQALLSIKQFIPYGYSHLMAYISGLQSGHQIGKTSIQSSIIENVGVLYENLSKKNQDLIMEQKAHRSQTTEWISQINNASKTVAGFQNAVEQIKLGMLKLETIPLPIYTEEQITPLPDTPEFDVASMSQTSMKQPIYLINQNGVYSNSFGLVKILNDKITSWDTKDNVFQSFKILTGKHANYGYLLLNLDLNVIRRRLIEDQLWLNRCFDLHLIIDKPKLTEALKGIKTKHQW